MRKPVILTGLRANSSLHIGNYFGALLPIIDMAQRRAGDYQINLFVPDLHSFTTPIDHGTLQERIMQNLKVFVAAGLPLDNPDVHMYRQSYVPAHSELTWILDCFTGMGQMGRMTQFKDKSAKLNEDHISVGLFNYPVLMAADVLLYNAEYVPVGDDQSQHLEFMRDIAERLNSRFSGPTGEPLFTLPRAVKEQHEFFGKDQGLRIRDLQDPSKKMSKSDETGKGVIFMDDAPDAAAKKVMSATTDSVGSIHYDYKAQPGISNLLEVYALLAKQPIVEVAAEWEGRTMYGELKSAVAEQVRVFLSEFQKNLAAVDQNRVQSRLQADEVTMNQTADETLLRVQKAVGLRP
jgi:tryptophanyl-tRNA synthetase